MVNRKSASSATYGYVVAFSLAIDITYLRGLLSVYTVNDGAWKT